MSEEIFEVCCKNLKALKSERKMLIRSFNDALRKNSIKDIEFLQKYMLFCIQHMQKYHFKS